MRPLVAASLLALTCHAQEEWLLKLTTRETRVEVMVVDENNNPLPNFPCGVGFTWPGKTADTYKNISKEGVTNERGIFIAEGRTQGIGIGTHPDGYYLSHRGEVFFKGSDATRWLPYPVTATLVMKKVVHPVPMYAMAGLKLTFPVKSGEFGYDLVERDWVPPHGKGKVGDLIFVHQKNESPYGSKATLTVRFSNPGDGLIPLFELQGAESELRLPRHAPEDGYQPERTLKTEWVGGRPTIEPDNPAKGYLFRVRTQLTPDGKVKNAWHGKIDGEFKWEVRHPPTGTVEFIYYLNPDGTRNLEFDREKNLFGELPPGQKVTRP